MRVLMISTDQKIFDPESAVYKRMLRYSALFDELHIVVFSLQKLKTEDMQLGAKCWVYPTRSSGRFSYISDAYRIFSTILSKIYFGETVISVQDPFETAIAGIRLKKKFKIPLQIQIHTDLFSDEFINSSIVNWFRFQISRFTLKSADAIRVVSQKIKNDLIRKLKISDGRISVLPIFVQAPNTVVQVDNLRGKYPKFNSIILMASRLSPEKNISLAINSFKKLLSKKTDVGLVIVGDGPSAKSLKALVARLGIESNVVFESWQSNLMPYYKTADLFLNTSNFEGYGMTLVEAGLQKCPVLTTNVGIAHDIFIDGINSLVCPVKDEKCIAKKLISFFDNPVAGNNLSENLFRDLSKIIVTEEEYLSKYRFSIELALKK